MNRFLRSHADFWFISFIFFLSLSSLFAADGTTVKQDKPTIAVSILPQAYFVERIAGNRAEALVIVDSGQNPHSYEPSPRQMVRLGSAAVWFTIGVDFERALIPKISSLFPSLKRVDSSRGVRYRLLEEGGGEGDTHLMEGGRDQHIWLGKEAAKLIGSNISETLAAMDPPGSSYYRANYEAFAKETDGVFAALGKDLLSLRGKSVFVYHPSFGYFLDEFGIGQIAVETGGKEPTQKGLADLVAKAKTIGARAIFVQAQFPSAAAKTLAKAIGGSVVPIDPLARDWLSNLKKMGEALKGASAR